MLGLAIQLKTWKSLSKIAYNIHDHEVINQCMDREFVWNGWFNFYCLYYGTPRRGSLETIYLFIYNISMLPPQSATPGGSQFKKNMV